MKRLTLTAAFFVLLFASTGTAGPLNPEHLPRDAKWVVHIDYDALSDTAVMDKLREARPELAQHVRSWLQERYGIDPREDLHGATLFSDTYDAHTGAVVLFADYDMEKVKSDLMSKPGVKMTQWQGHTLYTWTGGEGAPYEERGDRARDDRDDEDRDDEDRDDEDRDDEDRDDRDRNNRDRDDAGAREEDEDASEPRQARGQVAIALLEGGRVVFAPTPEQVQSAVKLLEGDAPSLADADSKLVADLPEGTIFYGAAIDLQQIAGREEFFPILQQHEHIRWVFGERDGRLYEEATFVARDEEVAGQVKTALEGFVALAKLWAADSKELASLYEDVQIEQEGSTVQVNWEGESQEVVAALQALGDRIARASGRERSRQ